MKNLKQNKKSAVWEYAVYLLVIILMLVVVPKYVMEKVIVDGSSMENSLYDGEKVLMEKVSRYFKGPERFDVVVFTRNHGTYTKTYIKRVIGLPGETVQIVDNHILINGEVISEDFGKNPMDTAGIAETPVLLGDDEYFVLGDNRRVSIDSRDKSVGAVKLYELDGKVILRIAPFSEFGTVR